MKNLRVSSGPYCNGRRSCGHWTWTIRGAAGVGKHERARAGCLALNSTIVGRSDHSVCRSCLLALNVLVHTHDAAWHDPIGLGPHCKKLQMMNGPVCCFLCCCSRSVGNLIAFAAWDGGSPLNNINCQSSTPASTLYFAVSVCSQ